MKLNVRRDEEDDGYESIWLITYSDMVTLLLAFFLLMYSFAMLGGADRSELVRRLNAIEAASPGEQSQLTPEQLEMTARKIADRFGTTGDDSAWIETSETEVTIGLPASVTFKRGDAALNPQARAILEEVGAGLAKMPNDIRIEGHTDDVPIRRGRFRSNWHLSAARAQAVVRLFIDQGVQPTRLQVVGYADTRPREPNDTDTGRRANRRIEIKLIRGGR